MRIRGLALGGSLCLVLSLVAGAGIGPSTAGANFNEDGCVQGQSNFPCPANSRHHIFFYDGLGPRLTLATENTRLGSYSTPNGWSTARTTDHNSSDVHYFYDTLEPGQVGIYHCIKWRSDRTCDHAHIRYDDRQVAGWSDGQLQALACHETGHSVGLLHPGDDGQPNDPLIFRCMIQGGYPNAPSDLGLHNRWHLETDPIYWP